MPDQRPHPSFHAHRRQDGMVTLIVMLFLVATVVFVATRMLDIGASNIIDSHSQGDGHAAFFGAESGLEDAQQRVTTGLAGNYTNATCTGVATTLTVGRASVTTSAVSEPATCDNSNGPVCSKCTVTSTGTVGLASRTVTQEMALTVRNGTFCNGATTNCSNSGPTPQWQLSLKNTTGYAAVGIFNLTYIEQGNNRATCAAGSNCRLQVDLTSPSSGQNAVGHMTNAVLIPNSTTYPIYQTMTRGGNNLVEVGTFFSGQNAAPTLTGPDSDAGAAAYWNNRNSQSGARTVGSGSSENTGATNDGTANSTDNCAAPSAGNNSQQTCASWCYGGDTLLFSYSARVAALTDQLSGVTFSTNASGGQNVAMTRSVKYPTNLLTGSPPANVNAEIWYARNANFNGAPLATNVSSYKGRGTAAVGAQWTTTSNSDTFINGTTLTVGNGYTGWPAQLILPGDAVASTGVSAGTTIVQQLNSGETGGMTSGRGGRGTYQVSISQTVNGANNRTWVVNSNTLNVSACSICNFAQNDPVSLSGLSAGRTINAAQLSTSTQFGRTETTGGAGRYPLSGATTRVASSTGAAGSGVYAGTPGTTLYLPSSGVAQPVVSTPPMLIRLKSGTGALAAGTTVQSISSPNAATNAFAVNTAPTTALDLASVCGGTCAFFVPGTSTSFSIAGMNSNFDGWAGGFVCLKGVDVTPQVVTSATSVTGRWTEVIK